MVLLTLTLKLSGQLVTAASPPWPRHVIDDSSRGADGVRMLDVNADGLLDISTGWEEGGVIRAYLHPGANNVRDHWPAVTVGNVTSAEDAVYVDLDGDGAIDVVSCCEGRTRSIFFHWAPTQPADFLTPDAWQTVAVPCVKNEQLWMFALPLDIDGRNGIDLIVGSKGDNGSIGWLESPANPRHVADWKYHRLRDAGWIMSLNAEDLDGDGDLDVVASDRKGTRRGILWLENPGFESARAGAGWPEHSVAVINREVMFLDVLRRDSNTTDRDTTDRDTTDRDTTRRDANGDADLQILAAVKPAGILWFGRSSDRKKSSDFELLNTLELPPDPIGTGKSVRAADIDLDGRLDLVFSCEQASGQKEGVFWLRGNDDARAPVSAWKRQSISGSTGVKFDLLQLVDLDADGDLDVITCEEKANLGVIWYENPAR